MTEYMASSLLVGRRPRISRMRWYSSAFSPSSAQGCSWSASSAAMATVSSTASIYRRRLTRPHRASVADDRDLWRVELHRVARATVVLRRGPGAGGRLDPHPGPVVGGGERCGEHAAVRGD